MHMNKKSIVVLAIFVIGFGTGAAITAATIGHNHAKNTELISKIESNQVQQGAQAERLLLSDQSKMSSKNSESGRSYTADELYKAVESNNERTVLQILESGTVDINTKTKNGRYPLEAVLLFDNLEMAELLLENGADPNVVTQNGKTIKDQVVSGSSKMLKQLFEQY